MGLGTELQEIVAKQKMLMHLALADLLGLCRSQHP